MLNTNTLVAKISHIDGELNVDDILSVSSDNSPLYEFQTYIINELSEDFKLIVESAVEYHNIIFDSNKYFTCLIKVSWDYELDVDHIDNTELYFYDFVVLSIGE
jgi:hypothetical protein